LKLLLLTENAICFFLNSEAVLPNYEAGGVATKGDNPERH
jgi:hypothetical protein